MKNQKLFSVEELSLMRVAEYMEVGCSNNVAGCGCDIIIAPDQPQQGVQHA